MPARKATDQDAPLPDPDEVLRVMLNTPPQPHTATTAKRKKSTKSTNKKPAK